MDYYKGSIVTVKDLKPRYTSWYPATVKKKIKLHNRVSRRRYKQYLRTGRIVDYNRSQRKLTRWDFD